MPAGRIILSHMDEVLDRAYHKAVTEMGAVLSTTHSTPTSSTAGPACATRADVERLEMTTWLLSEGYGDQLVIACNTWAQASLPHMGGFGYKHLFRRIVPTKTEFCGDDEGGRAASHGRHPTAASEPITSPLLDPISIV